MTDLVRRDLDGLSDSIRAAAIEYPPQPVRRLSVRLALVPTLILAGAVPAAASAAVHERSDFQRHFDAAGTVGTMVVRLDGPRPETIVVGDRRSRRRFLPSSTFEIPSSLLAIDRGVASGAGPELLVDGRPFLRELAALPQAGG
jgi:hypothetical protein